MMRDAWWEERLMPKGGDYAGTCGGEWADGVGGESANAERNDSDG